MTRRPRALRLLGPQNYERWQQLGEAIRRTLPLPTFQRTLSDDIGAWRAEEQRAWLDAVHDLLPRAARTAVTIYRETPGAVRGLAAEVRAPAIRLLQRAAATADPAEIDALVPVLGALVLDVPEADRVRALDIAESIAQGCPVAVPGLLRCLARVVEEASHDDLRAWAARGLEIASTNQDAARVYFAFHSRTSIRVLHASPTAVALEEIEAVLHRYIQMLSGHPAFVRAEGPFRLRPPLEAHPDAGGVALPAIIEFLDTWEDNFRLYRVLAAYQAARREFGTYDIAELLDRLRDKERLPALEECFLLADGYRLAHRLRATYPGIRTELDWAAGALLARWQRVPPGPFHLLDGLLAHAILQCSNVLPHPADRQTAPLWLAGIAAVAQPCLQPLDAPHATAGDALAVAELLAGLLSLPSARDGMDTTLTASEEFLLGVDEGGDLSGTGDDALSSRIAAPEPPEELSAELSELQLRLGELADNVAATGRAPTPEELERLIEAGLLQQLGPRGDATAAQSGLYITQLLGKLLGDRATGQKLGMAATRRGTARLADEGPLFLYDEWDHVIADYRPRWCSLREVELGDDAGLFFTRTLERYARLVPEIRRQFQRVRPESWRTLRGLEDGEDFDLNAVIDARAEWRARRSPSSKLYTARARLEREVATLFLLDMSASTDEAVGTDSGQRRIIDIEKEALVIMAAALEELGDAYAIYGFSGQGRDNVEFYPIKGFNERLAAGAKGRIGGIEPRCSTRMGTALRHSLRKMRDVRVPNRHLMLISDGFPQDLDYGEDRRSYAYGISDTAVALREIEAAGIKPFCITVDLAGHDYLREMCDPQRYMVIENVGDLPSELPKVYQRLVRAA